MDKFSISESDYEEILLDLGYPTIPEEDLEFKRETIQEKMIFPALREYFKWFPLTEIVSYRVSSSFSIDFPSEDVYGVLDSRINSSISSDRTSSPFLNDLLIRQHKGGAYGTENDYGLLSSRIIERSEMNSLRNSSKAFRVSVDSENRIVSGYINSSSELIITWAKYSTNFSSVPFKRKDEVLKLAKAYVLEAFAMLRGQMDTDIGMDFNVSAFEDKATEYKESIMKKWKEMSKVIIMR